MATDNPGTRINKYMASSGFCSRREADQIIADGRVTINGEIAEAGARVQDGQIVRVDDQPILQDEDYVYIALNKPAGITSTTDTRRTDNIVDFVGHDKRIFPIGRLDRDSEGLILLTSDGSIVNKILRASNHHEKEYIVTVDRPIDDKFIHDMSSGVPILNTVTRPCRIKPEKSPRMFRIVLTQGLNRQIRRMCEVFGYTVTRLVRVRIMNITLGSLKPGQWRDLTFKELKQLKSLLRESSEQPDAD